MKTILVATDFSPAALNAAGYAADMAMAINADLYLLHVYRFPLSYSDIDFAMSTIDMEKIADKDMHDFMELLIQKTGNKLNITSEVRPGGFFPELQEVCSSLDPYAVVMGCQGTTAAERILMGGHAVYAMKHLTWPLITVPVGAKFLQVKKIGLACDLKDVINTTPIDEIKTLVKDFNAELHILNTGKESEFSPEVVFESGMLQEMIYDLHPKYHFITNKDTDSGIIEFADNNHIDLLIVLPKRHGILDQLVHRSHTRQIVLHSHVPVMALHQ